MNPNRPITNDYGLHGNRIFAVPYQQTQTNYSDSPGLSPSMINNNAHSVTPAQLVWRKGSSGQAGVVVGLRSRNFDQRKPIKINSVDSLYERNLLQKEIKKQLHYVGNVTNRLTSEKQKWEDQIRYAPNSFKSIQTVPSLGFLVPKTVNNERVQIQRFYDFLYKIMGILSCNVRVIQRSTIRHLVRYGNSVNRTTGFYRKLNSIVINKLKNAVNIMKQCNYNYNKSKNIKIENSATISNRVDKKNTNIDELRDENFYMEESKVQRGLKYLQQRSKMRKKLQQQNLAKKPAQQSSIMKTNKQRQCSNRTNDLKNCERVRQKQMLKNQGHKQLLSPSKLKLTPEMAKSEDQKHVQINAMSNKIYFQSVKRQEQPLKKLQHTNYQKQSYLKLERQSDIIKLASCIISNLDEKPYDFDGRKQIFDRCETSERKYHLNPISFKQSQPDFHENSMTLLNGSASFDELQVYDQDNHQGMLEQRNTYNVHEDTLPLFDPTNNEHATRHWEAPQKMRNNLDTIFKNKSQNKLINPYFQNQILNRSPEFQNLPSFNEKNRILQGKRNEVQSGKIKTLEEQQKQPEKQRRKNESNAHKNKLKSRQNSFKISDEDYSIEQKFDQHQKNSNRKMNRISQYFTDNNVFAQRIKSKQQNTRASYDFPQENKNSNKEIIKRRPISRPKSMTYSGQKSCSSLPMIANLEQKNAVSGIHETKKKIQNQNERKPEIKITIQGSKTKKLIPISQINRKPGLTGLQHPSPGHIQQNLIINKPNRAVSSQCRFFYGPPPQSTNAITNSIPLSFNAYHNTVEINNRVQPIVLPNSNIKTFTGPITPISTPYGLMLPRQSINTRGPSQSAYGYGQSAQYVQPGMVQSAKVIPQHQMQHNPYNSEYQPLMNSFQRSQQMHNTSRKRQSGHRKGIQVSSPHKFLNSYHSQKNLNTNTNSSQMNQITNAHALNSINSRVTAQLPRNALNTQVHGSQPHPLGHKKIHVTTAEYY